MIEYINKRKNKNHIKLSIDAEKAFDKVQHHFLIKTLHSIGIEGTYLNIITVIYEKPTAIIILNGEKLRAFPLRSGTWQRCPLPHLCDIAIQHSTRSPSLSNQTTKRNKSHLNQQRSQTLTLCRQYNTLCGKPKRLQSKTARTHTGIQ